MLKKLLFAALLLLTIIVSGGFFLPVNYHIERTIVIERPVATMFSLLNGYQSFEQWSPWAAMDPQAVYVISGPTTGPGAKLSWKGDPRTVGEGWQTITSSQPYERINMHLNFGEQGVAESYFQMRQTSAPLDSGTHLTWAMDTDVSSGKGVLGALLSRYFGLFLDKWVGADFEQGLAALKSYAEQLPAADFEGAPIDIVEAEAMPILFVSGTSSQEASDVAVALGSAFGKVMEFINSNDITVAGQPMAITRSWNENGYTFDAAIPVSGRVETFDEVIRFGYSPQGEAVRYTYTGPYDGMLEAYEMMASYMSAHGLKEGAVSWEHYISDPGETPEDEIITYVYFLTGE